MIIMCAHMASYHLISFQVSLRQGPLTPLYCPSYCPSSLWTSRSGSRQKAGKCKRKIASKHVLETCLWPPADGLTNIFVHCCDVSSVSLFSARWTLELMRHSSVSKFCDAWLPLIMSGNAPCNFNCREKAKISMMPHSATVFIQLPHEGEPNSKVQPWS